MLSTLPLARILVNKAHTTRQIVARVASRLMPMGHLSPMTHEALCYACMVGIVMPTMPNMAPTHPPQCRHQR